MSYSESSDWDDDDDIPGRMEDGLDVSEEEISEALGGMRRSAFENRVIKTFIDNAHEFGGTNTLLEVINSIERKMGWRSEFLADKNALDDYVFFAYETFHEDMWGYYSNSDSFSQLTYDVAFLAERNMTDFTDTYMNGPSLKSSAKSKLRNILWRIYKSL